MSQVNVTNEIGKLKKVLLHRPGKELLNLTPDTLERLLFDDIPYLKDAINEHNQFANILKENGVEVVYLEDLMTETLGQNEKIKEQFIRQFVNEANIKTSKHKKELYEFLKSIEDNKELVLKTMEGVQIKDLKDYQRLNEDPNRLIADPMPNLYFTRDPFASISDGISLNKMYSITRNRETIYAEYIFKYHPEYNGNNIYYSRYNPYHIEGGDILNLNEHTLAIGISQRTQIEAIQKLAQNLFKDNRKIDTILAFTIPEERAFMHLDTVFTQIDYDKFTYYHGIMETLHVFEIKEGDDPTTYEDLEITEIDDTLENILEKYLERQITLIPCAGGDKIAAEREQWNDGSNTLCIAPGTVIVYDRNNITNEELRKHGIKVIEMKGAELSRGRGGPRCMSMPLEREKI